MKSDLKCVLFGSICAAMLMLVVVGCAGRTSSTHPAGAGWRYVEPGFGQDPVWQRQFTNDQQRVDIEISPTYER